MIQLKAGVRTSSVARMTDPIARLRIRDGVVPVCSDGHYWPGVPVPAHERFCLRLRHLRDMGELAAVIYNGDAFDGARVSRHTRIGWEKQPHVADELQECQRRLNTIEDICEDVPLFWTLGNHDMRFETRLASAAPEYEHIKGLHLKDHFPRWKPCWGVRINRDVVVKHRINGGLHARYNNVIKAACTVITSHTHRLGVTAYTAYGRTHWGGETGMLGNPNGPMFVDYTEAGPLNWQMGWLELEFVRGRLRWPRVMHVEDPR